MNRDSDLLHLFVAVLMMAPIFVFYAFIAAEAFGYRPVERMPTISPLVLAQVCTAFAKGALPVN
jgi:hypothetical protein